MNTKPLSNMPPMRTGASDHFQTPPYALNPLLPYLRPEWTIWEPACGKGNIVRTLKDHDFEVLASDIEPLILEAWESDFLQSVPHAFFSGRWHCIVTNPPFSKKDDFLERCYRMGKPFALLMPLTALEGLKRQELYKRHGLELLIPNKRIAFETPGGKSGKASSPQFLTAWYTWGLNIGSELTFVSLDAAPVQTGLDLETEASRA